MRQSKLPPKVSSFLPSFIFRRHLEVIQAHLPVATLIDSICTFGLLTRRRTDTRPGTADLDSLRGKRRLASRTGATGPRGRR